MPIRQEAHRDGEAEGAIDGRLLGQEATDPLAGFIEGAGRQGDVSPADEANEPIPEIFALDEEEDDQHQDDPRPARGSTTGASALSMRSIAEA